MSPIELQRQSIIRQQQSVERQQSSVQQQAGSRSPRFVAHPVTAPGFQMSAAGSASTANCAPVEPLVLQRVVDQAARKYSLSANLIHALIRQESGGNPCAISNKGAMGLMQLMPETANEMGASEPFDIDQNVFAGTRYLSELMQRYQGDLNRVLGAYNAGPAAVDRVGGPPPFPETLSYIRSIMQSIKTPLDPKLFPASIR